MLLDETPDAPPRGQEWRAWKTGVLIRYRDDQLEFLARAKKNGWDPYPIPLVVRMLEQELDKRRVNPKVYDQECEFGPYEVVADVEDLSL